MTSSFRNYALFLFTLTSSLLAFIVPAYAAGTVELIVQRDAGLTSSERSDIRSDAGVSFKRSSTLSNVELVTVPAGDAADALKVLNADSDVQFAERNGVVKAQTMPPYRVAVNDALFLEQYSISNTGQPVSGGTYSTTAGSDMKVRYAWNLASGAGVNVAIIDTGTDTSHPDLINSLYVNPGEIAGNGIDDDLNGYIDDVSGWDFAGADNNPSHADNGHGTHVSGIVAAQRNNGRGVAGVAPLSKFVPLRALGSDGSGSWLSVAEALDYAGEMGFPVANASLGGYGNLSIIDDVITAHPNTLYVFAAGNEGRDLDTTDFYPCESPESNVLCVGATDLQDKRVSWSNYSPTAVDISAPGLNVMSTYPSDQYAWMAGTSMASPNAAGVAALIVGAGVSPRGAALKSLMMSTAETNAALSSFVVSGRADALAAVRTVISDEDNDGVADTADSCPSDYGLLTSGCSDVDGDGILDSADNCPAAANPDQLDSDSDGAGDACDSTPNGPVDNDPDNDGVLSINDNCPSIANSNQSNADLDEAGDVCDATPRGADSDGDGVPALDDRCPTQVGSSSNYGCPAVVSPPVVSPPVVEPPVVTPPVVAPPVVEPPVVEPPVVNPPVVMAPTIELLRAAAQGKKASFKIRADMNSAAKTKLQRKSCSKSRCSWKTIKTFSLKLKAAKTSSVKAGSVTKGTYRLSATVTASSLSTSAVSGFKVN